MLLAAALAGFLAACGGGDDESDDAAACAESGAPTAKGQVTLLAANTKESGVVMADAACQPLYVNDVDTSEKISCVGECARVWIPFTLPARGSVRAETPQQIGQVELVKRPDGETQVALNGQPLYLFSGDDEAGVTNGEGVSDGFGGTDYEWSVLTLEEAAAQAPTSSAPQAPPPGAQAPPPGAQRPQQPKTPSN
jgi:predicted lipoprotein with Yx(FWY)xxD motif